MRWWFRFLDGEFRAVHMTLRVVAIGSFLLIVARWAGMPIPHPAVVFGWVALCLKTLLKIGELITLWLRRGSEDDRKPAQFNSYKAIAHTELRIYRWFIASWRKAPEVDGGHSFQRGPIYHSLVYVLWFSFLTEIPFMLLVSHLVPSFQRYALIVDACAVLLAIYVIVLFRADKFAVRHTSHRITEDRLIIAMGMRVDGSIALRDIVDVAVVPARTWNDRARAWRLAGHGVAKVSPLDKPNVVLEVLEGRAVLTWMHGMTTAPRHIGLYLDEPARFIAELETARARLDAGVVVPLPLAS